MKTRCLWTIATVTALLIVSPTASLTAQEGESDPDPGDPPPSETDADTPRHRPPPGPVVLAVTTGRIHFLSGLPAAYLDGLTGRIVETDHALDDRVALGLRLGARLGERWMVEGELTAVDTKFGLANLHTDVVYRGMNAYRTLFGPVYATVGAGSVTYDFETSPAREMPPRNTDFAVNAGVGIWTAPHFFGDRFTWRTELRDYVSWLTVPALETRAQHHLGFVSGLSVSLF